jgi:hypothetical protein
MRRGGGGSCTGPVEVNRGPLMTSGTLYRPGRPRISLRPLSSPSVPHHLYRGPKSGGRNLKSSPCTHRTGSSLVHRTAGPTGKRRRRGGGGSCTGPVEVNGGPFMTSGLVRLIGGCTVYRLGRHRISLASLSSPSVPHHLYRGGRNLKGFAPLKYDTDGNLMSVNLDIKSVSGTPGSSGR